MYLQNHSSLNSLLKEVNDLFVPSELLRDSFFDNNWKGEYIPVNLTPKLDISEEEDTVIIKIASPGYKKEELELSLQHNILNIKGQKKEVEGKEKQAFERQVKLSDELDSEKAISNYEDGILTISIPKKEETKAKNLPIL